MVMLIYSHDYEYIMNQNIMENHRNLIKEIKQVQGKNKIK